MTSRLWKHPNGRWYFEIRANRRKYRFSARSGDKAVAREMLRQKEQEIARRGPVALDSSRITYDGLEKHFVTDYEINGKRSLGRAKQSCLFLSRHFSGWTAQQITTVAVYDYVQARQREGRANATINRELAALKRMFRLMLDVDPHFPVPRIALLKEAPPRAGFFEREQFEALLGHLRPEVKPVALFAYETGWRLREVLNLEWRHVDLQEGCVRLDAAMTKNGRGRVAYLTPRLQELLRGLTAATRELQDRRGVNKIPWVFHRRGQRIFRFYGSWRTACAKAGCPGMLFHDLRRTAIRNMIRAGVHQTVAMQISGHQTTSVFNRYNITSDEDLKEAARRISNSTLAVGIENHGGR
jgi:integrase